MFLGFVVFGVVEVLRGLVVCLEVSVGSEIRGRRRGCVLGFVLGNRYRYFAVFERGFMGME